MTRHLTSLYDLTPQDVLAILDSAADLKARHESGERPQLLQGRVLAQMFEKPSLRTRNSFEAAMINLGGAGIFLTTEEAGLSGRESLRDVATVLSSYSDIITMRTFSQQLIEDFAKISSCPVINALSDERHPCQALTDLLTIRESFGRLEGLHLVFVGDGNNVAMSLAIACAMTGMKFTLAVPQGFLMPQEFCADLADRFPGSQVEQVHDPSSAVRTADVVYTDVWASMGQEEEAERRQRAFADFQVNAALMNLAPAATRFMHDLPAKRGLEVTDDVMDGSSSIVFQQAENRMHLARGLFAWLLAE
ncbi:MAG: ornithine carbamoyltransferase [Fuerstiella sp.]|nr:ornithine carbamoyltransferase [Fuerstiella sp.]MCP4785564.1 ornithine carbamoyltransferase [Fuerstiella sp.]MCP4853627.1 ornithine carbamoyltransferase [Fuerstiella sp.]